MALSDKTPDQLYISSGEVPDFLPQRGSGEVFCEVSNGVHIELARGIHWEDRSVMSVWPAVVCVVSNNN